MIDKIKKIYKDGNTALEIYSALYIIHFSMLVIDESCLVLVSIFSCKQIIQSRCWVNINNGMPITFMD